MSVLDIRPKSTKMTEDELYVALIKIPYDEMFRHYVAWYKMEKFSTEGAESLCRSYGWSWDELCLRYRNGL